MTLSTEERARIGRRNRNRGKTVQREYARYNCTIWHVLPETHAVWTTHHPDNEYHDCPGEHCHVEVKAEKTWNLPAYIREAEQDAINGSKGSQTLGVGSHWWIGMKPPLGQHRSYYHPFYVCAPELHYLERCVQAYTELDWQDVYPRTDEALIELRRRMMEFRGLPLDYRSREQSQNWRLASWVPQLEQLAFDAGETAWTLVLEAPAHTESYHYLHSHYILEPGLDWAQLLQIAWEKGRSGRRP